MTRGASAEATIVGRQEEIDCLARAIDRLPAAGGDAIFLVGEPGIGKSTLARVAAAGAQARGVPVFWAFAWESGGAPAYWPWTQLLRSVVDHHELDPRMTAGLGQILPDTGHGNDADLDPGQARFRLLENVRTLLDHAGRRSPCVLIFEDLHAADRDSINLLLHVARHVRNMPVLLMGTLRPADARRASGAAALWSSLRNARVLELQRLTEDEVRDFLAAEGGKTPDAKVVRDLLSTSAGNPLFLSELTGMLRRQPGVDLASLRLPETVQQVIGQQIALLPPATRDVLQRASILGRRVSLAAMRAMSDDEAALEQRLAPALDADILRPVTAGELEFAHVLYRDVLYQGIDRERREAWHRQRAEAVRGAIERDGTDRWSELAMHLDAAGEARRADAVDAWREAGRRARERLALDEATRSCRRALDTMGDAARFPPTLRVRLLLELAEAMLAGGDVDDGHGRCREAFELARSLDDAALMADAALTYGSVIVVAKVDRDLVSMLAESLARLPADALASRARVQARLAAARQPSPNPAEPMAQARDAIRLARESGEPRVIYDVLTSAISALMDFAPVDERMPLNREAEALADRFRDTPGQFRCHLRLMMDASERCDREMMDAAIGDAERIAERVGLPHYQWRIASARAMQATLDGRYRQAQAALDRAAELARIAGDASARVTIPVQRFAILCEWSSPEATPFEAIEEELGRAFAAFPDAEVYARPMVASFAVLTGRPEGARALDDATLIERIFAGEDRFCVAHLGEVAVALGRMELVARASDVLLPHRDCGATMGLLGMHWDGPVATTLGVLATALGRYEDAAAHFDVAFEVANRMRSPPQLARVHAGRAELAEKRGRTRDAADHAAKAAALAAEYGLRLLRAPGSALRRRRVAAPPDTAKAVSMQLDGDIWSVAYGDGGALLKDTRGLAMLARLLSAPDTDIHVLDLSGGREAVDGGDAGPALDEQARREYRRRAGELSDELAEAESLGDAGRAEALRAERDFLSAELSRAFGLGGRARAVGRSAERARVNVRRRIKDAIERIAEQLPAAGRYLENTIKTGTYCRYSPL